MFIRDTYYMLCFNEVLEQIWPRGYKTFFMLNLAKHEILNAHKYKKISRKATFLGSGKPRMLFYLLINVKMPTIVGILTHIVLVKYVW